MNTLSGTKETVPVCAVCAQNKGQARLTQKQQATHGYCRKHVKEACAKLGLSGAKLAEVMAAVQNDSYWHDLPENQTGQKRA